MYKAVVSGFEDTLIDKYEAIDVSTMLEIDRIRKNKALFIVSSNNSLDYILPYNRDFPFLDFIIALNGAIVYDVNLERIILRKKILYSVVKKIVSKFFQYDIYVYTAFSRIKVRDLSDIESNKRDILKIDIYNKKGSINNILKQLKLMNLELEYLVSEYDGEKFVEIVSLEASRFTGVEKILSKKKIVLSECGMIGGNIGDLEMVKKLNGDCVSNAPYQLRKIAKNITVERDSKGVREFLEKIKF